MKYSEKELLMLSNFLYLDASQEKGTISEILERYKNDEGLFTAASVKGAGTGGGLDAQMVSELFTEMQKECDSNPVNFGQLSGARYLEENDVRGICFTNSKDKNPVVVFRGTGGTKEAWQDNMYGGFEADTRLQKTANDFVQYECGIYKNITVTGHSKGGNLSQYVTVLNPGRIKSCVSFDGQGMGDDFISQNQKLIKKASGKIKSISAYNDYVNILLTSIAGSAVYVNNSEKGINAHSSFFMLKSNDFDTEGNFTSFKEQSLTASVMDKTVDKIVDILGKGEDKDNLITASILGEAIATMVGSSSAQEALGGVKKAASDAMLAFSDKISGLIFSNENPSNNLYSKYIYFDYNGMKGVGDCIYEAGCENKRMVMKIEDIISHMDINIASKFYADLAFSKILNRMNTNTDNMFKTQMIIEETCGKYADCESKLALQMQCYEN